MAKFEIGNKTVALDEVFAASPPTRKEFATFCGTLGLITAGQSSCLSTFRLTAESCEHPWFIYLLSQMVDRIRQGQCLSNSIQSALKTLIQLRAQQLTKEFESFSGEPEQTTEQEPPYWNPNQPNHWSIPNYFAHFAEFIQFVDAGEESGELDTGMSRLCEINLNAGVVNSYDEVWGKDVSLFCILLEMLLSAGLPLTNAIKIIGRSSTLCHELDLVLAELEKGETLSTALKQTGGKLAHPTLVAIIESSESSGELQMALIRLQHTSLITRVPK